MRFADAIVVCLEFTDAFGLTLECDDAETVAIEEREHVAMDIKHQHTAGMMKSRERQFFLHVRTQRQAIRAIIFYVHERNEMTKRVYNIIVALKMLILNVGPDD